MLASGPFATDTFFVKSAILSASTSSVDSLLQKNVRSSVNSSTAPVSFVASPVQLVLNLFDVLCIACSECDVIGKDREQ
jgi:hypothetical protein